VSDRWPAVLLLLIGTRSKLLRVSASEAGTRRSCQYYDRENKPQVGFSVKNIVTLKPSRTQDGSRHRHGP